MEGTPVDVQETQWPRSDHPSPWVPREGSVNTLFASLPGTAMNAGDCPRVYLNFKRKGIRRKRKGTRLLKARATE